MTETWWYCHLCHEAFALDDENPILHMRIDHDIDLQTWPDGELVVVDTTLEPDDFKELQ